MLIVPFSELKDNKDRGRKKAMMLRTNEFTGRFLQHVLPLFFMRLGISGFCPDKFKTKKGQYLALTGKDTYMPVLEGVNAMEVIEVMKQSYPFICPKMQKREDDVQNKGPLPEIFKTGSLTYHFH